MDQVDQHGRDFAWVGGQEIERGGNAAGFADRIRRDPVPFVIALDRGAQTGPGVDEGMVAPAIGVAVEQQRRLVDAIDHAVGRDIARRAGQAGEGGKKVGHVDHVANQLPRLDRTRPPGLSRNTNLLRYSATL